MTENAMPKNKKPLLVIVGAVVFLCVVCAVFGTIQSSTPEAKATATARAEERAAEASRPTATPRPTNTPRPTATPRATNTPRPTVGPVRGWLCDWDNRGAIVLWDVPGLSNRTAVATVPVGKKGCVDALSLEERSVSLIIFYRVTVGGDEGWVDLDYFYPVHIGKPDWSQ